MNQIQQQIKDKLLLLNDNRLNLVQKINNKLPETTNQLSITSTYTQANSKLLEGYLGSNNDQWFILKNGNPWYGEQGSIGDIFTINAYKGLSRIGSNFREWTKLISGNLIINEGIIELGSVLFFYIWDLRGILTFPKTLKKIGERCFYQTGFTTLNTKSNVSLGESCFANCTNLTSINSVNGDYILFVDGNCFSSCISLISVPKIKLNANTYGTFQSCTNLKNIEIVDSINIGTNCFYSCINLESITLPTNLNSISMQAFYNTPKLTNIEIPLDSGNVVIYENVFSRVQTGLTPKTITLTGNGTLSLGYQCFVNSDIVLINWEKTWYTYYEAYDLTKIARKIARYSTFTDIDISHWDVTRLEYQFIENCKISGVLKFPETLNQLEYSALVDSTIPTVEIPESVVQINNSAILRCYINKLVFKNSRGILNIDANGIKLFNLKELWSFYEIDNNPVISPEIHLSQLNNILINNNELNYSELKIYLKQNFIDLYKSSIISWGILEENIIAI